LHVGASNRYFFSELLLYVEISLYFGSVSIRYNRESDLAKINRQEASNVCNYSLRLESSSGKIYLLIIKQCANIVLFVSLILKIVLHKLAFFFFNFFLTGLNILCEHKRT
jgi:hypothetical protein